MLEMRRLALVMAFFLVSLPLSMLAEDTAASVRRAVEASTLDEAGTKPFHLKASYAPSFERDQQSHRSGEIEIWWESPEKWRREVSAPGFHQVAIVDGTMAEERG
jgi:hypothetical protein